MGTIHEDHADLLARTGWNDDTMLEKAYAFIYDEGLVEKFANRLLVDADEEDAETNDSG